MHTDTNKTRRIKEWEHMAHIANGGADDESPELGGCHCPPSD